MAVRNRAEAKDAVGYDGWIQVECSIVAHIDEREAVDPGIGSGFQVAWTNKSNDRRHPSTDLFLVTGWAALRAGLELVGVAH